MVPHLTPPVGRGIGALVYVPVVWYLLGKEGAGGTDGYLGTFDILIESIVAFALFVPGTIGFAAFAPINILAAGVSNK
jgi:hypothetical protein